ncbi:MAG: hypothetical protein C0505_17495 [Leptothrix sp. (in: Bacteria)]|nr:hypothetical protein [Leptothrix sp. (in: b-proteobacteria)]
MQFGKDAAEDSIWRNVYVAVGSAVPAPDPRGNWAYLQRPECWSAGLHELATVEAIGPILDDGTAFVLMGRRGEGFVGVLRIRLVDGLPGRWPSNVRMVPYDQLLRFKMALEEARDPFGPLVDPANAQRLEGRQAAAMLQQYLFPHLAAPRVRATLRHRPDSNITKRK